MARLYADAEGSGHGRFALWALVLRALVLRGKGESSAALEVLGRALGQAEGEGYVRVFADEGEPMAELLGAAAARGIAAGYVERLLGAFNQDKQTSRQGDREQGLFAESSISLSLAEPLSSRELEVLRLMAAGEDNGQIARALVVAVSTVKSHVNHIFGKLGARNRVEAVRRAQDLDLL